jgi:hypothetical protein
VERFGASLLRLFGPCAARGVGREVSFLQEACTVWRGKRLRCLCFRIRHPSEVSPSAMMSALHRHETGGTLELLKRLPSFRASKPPEPYVRFQRVRCSTGASLSVSQCRLARVLLIAQFFQAIPKHHDGLLRPNVTSKRFCKPIDLMRRASNIDRPFAFLFRRDNDDEGQCGSVREDAPRRTFPFDARAEVTPENSPRVSTCSRT